MTDDDAAPIEDAAPDADEGLNLLKVQIIPVTAFLQNCCLLFDADDKVGVVVDPGGEVAKIQRMIEKTGVTVEAIWLTHGHVDHAGGAMELKEKLGGIPIIGPHEADKPLLENIERQAAMFGAGEGYRNAVPDRWLSEGDTISFGTHVFEVLHTPGHAPGHVVFFHREARFLHAGDVLFNGSIGRTDLMGGDHSTLIRSIRDKILPLGDDVAFICGHGKGGTLGEERRSNPFLV